MAREQNEELGILELDANLAEVEKPPELPPGQYKGEVQDVQIQDSQKGNRYFAIKFVIPVDELPADMQEHYEDGATLYWNRQIVPNGRDRRALFSLKSLIESLGLDSNTTQVDPNEWMGCQALLRVKSSKYQGQVRAEISALEPVDDAPVAATRSRQAAPAAEPEEGAARPARGRRAAAR